jgi:hypothetical protein
MNEQVRSINYHSLVENRFYPNLQSPFNDNSQNYVHQEEVQQSSPVIPMQMNTSTSYYPIAGINENNFLNVCSTYEIRSIFADALRQLAEYKIILICDDSGSMQFKCDGDHTRWDELLSFVSTIFYVNQIVDNSFIDIHFMNRPSILNVKEFCQIQDSFINPPRGGTPTVSILREVLRKPFTTDWGYKGRIIIIITDGEPINQQGNSDVRELYRVLKNERASTDYITFLACTDDEESVGYLNEWDNDESLLRLDVVDDYKSEKEQILEAQGKNFTFTRGDYIVKTILGSVIPTLDKLDKKPENNSSQYDLTNFRSLTSSRKPHKYKYDDYRDDRGCTCRLF